VTNDDDDDDDNDDDDYPGIVVSTYSELINAPPMRGSRYSAPPARNAAKPNKNQTKGWNGDYEIRQ
jgi:hypothetical protein